MKQVLINLFINSLEAVPKDNGIISVKLEKDSSNNKIILIIYDNGGGINSEIVSKIFEPFFTTKASGTGLGLYLCYNYLQQLNAKIEFKNLEDGTGSEFRIII